MPHGGLVFSNPDVRSKVDNAVRFASVTAEEIFRNDACRRVWARDDPSSTNGEDECAALLLSKDQG